MGFSVLPKKSPGQTLDLSVIHIPSTKTNSKPQALEKIDGLIGKLSLFWFGAVAVIFREGQVARIKHTEPRSKWTYILYILLN